MHGVRIGGRADRAARRRGGPRDAGLVSGDGYRVVGGPGPTVADLEELAYTLPAARGRRGPARHRVVGPDARGAGVRPAEPGRDRGATGPGRRVRRGRGRRGGPPTACASWRRRCDGRSSCTRRPSRWRTGRCVPGSSRWRASSGSGRSWRRTLGGGRRGSPWPRWRAAWSLGSVGAVGGVPAAGPLPPPDRARRRSPRGVAAGCPHRRRSRGAGDAGARLVRPFAPRPGGRSRPCGRCPRAPASCSDSCRRPGPTALLLRANPPQLPAPRTVAAVLDNVARSYDREPTAVAPGHARGSHLRAAARRTPTARGRG